MYPNEKLASIPPHSPPPYPHGNPTSKNMLFNMNIKFDLPVYDG